jgi:hypothetical protein
MTKQRTYEMSQGPASSIIDHLLRARVGAYDGGKLTGPTAVGESDAEQGAAGRAA